MKTLNELSESGKIGMKMPKTDLVELPENLKRQTDLNLPEISEPEVVRHFTNLSTKNHHIDKGFYPLGSCTMKYNPKVNEAIAGDRRFAEIHPKTPTKSIQGTMQILFELEQMLCNITGLDKFTLQPVAGAHGELTAVMVMQAYHRAKGEERKTILIPDSAHGTNPASVIIGGFQTVQVKSDDSGRVDLIDLTEKINPDVAGMMLTNPNTLGIFESDVRVIADKLHEIDALFYMDGANMNALMGITNQAEMGFDITHLNLHKTFSTPHGGGGPGAGPIGVVEKLAKFLPVPHIVKNGDLFDFDFDIPNSIGRVHSYFGNFAVLLRAWVYIKMMGADGLKQISENAILNANYLRHLLKNHFKLGYETQTMHEFVLSGAEQKKRGAKTLDIAKRLLDYGFHAPTIYFPLIVEEALMIEPTESESIESLEEFAQTMLKIDAEITENPDLLKNAPQTTPVKRLDEAKASRELKVSFGEGES